MGTYLNYKDLKTKMRHELKKAHLKVLLDKFHNLKNYDLVVLMGP